MKTKGWGITRLWTAGRRFSPSNGGAWEVELTSFAQRTPQTTEIRNVHPLPKNRHRASTSTRWYFTFGLCCHSNKTRAPMANPPNSAQLEGTPTTPPSYIRVRAVVWACGEGQTDRYTHTEDRRAWPIYISRRLRLTRNVTTFYVLWSSMNVLRLWPSDMTFTGSKWASMYAKCLGQRSLISKVIVRTQRVGVCAAYEDTLGCTELRNMPVPPIECNCITIDSCNDRFVCCACLSLNTHHDWSTWTTKLVGDVSQLCPGQ